MPRSRTWCAGRLKRSKFLQLSQYQHLSIVLEHTTMLRSMFMGGVRNLSFSAPLRSTATLATKTATSSTQTLPDLRALKFDSNGSKDLYAICKIHNMPYLVTKGDRLILPYKIKGYNVGDVLKLDQVVTLGSRNFTYNNAKGIPEKAFSLTATLAEITREPLYHVYKKKPRCRRLKTLDVEPYQTHLVINELKLN
ncbi:hypothetical protein OY671_002511 [Metschnikowia pulcherrima]|nr:hypothetical protein OY671_002511 [Metschnikowia pulcherrima]